MQAYVGWSNLGFWLGNVKKTILLTRKIFFGFS